MFSQGELRLERQGTDAAGVLSHLTTAIMTFLCSPPIEHMFLIFSVQALGKEISCHGAKVTIE